MLLTAEVKGTLKKTLQSQIVLDLQSTQGLSHKGLDFLKMTGNIRTRNFFLDGALINLKKRTKSNKLRAQLYSCEVFCFP